MKIVLDVENNVTKLNGKLHLDPFTPTNSLVMVGIQIEGEEPRHWTFDHEQYNPEQLAWSRKQDCEEIQSILDKTTVLIAHNAQHDLMWMWNTGFKYEGKIWDTMLAEYVLSLIQI